MSDDRKMLGFVVPPLPLSHSCHLSVQSRVESNYGLVWWAENISFGLARFGSTKKSLVLVDIPPSVACDPRPLPVIIPRAVVQN